MCPIFFSLVVVVLFFNLNSSTRVYALFTQLPTLMFSVHVIFLLLDLEEFFFYIYCCCCCFCLHETILQPFALKKIFALFFVVVVVFNYYHSQT